MGHLVRRDRPPAGARQAHEAARPAARPVRALAGDRRRHGLLLAEPAADRRRARGDVHGHQPRHARDARAQRPRARPRRRDRGLRRRRSCRSRTRASTSCSATPSCTTCPTSTAASPSSSACSSPAARCSSPASRRARATGSRAVPKQAAWKLAPAVAARDQGAPGAQPPRRDRRGRARARGRRRRPRLRPRRPRAPRGRAPASPTCACAARSCWRTGSAGSTARWRPAPSPRTSRGAGSSTPTAATSCSSASTARLLEPRLPPRIFYNLMLAARKPGVTPPEHPPSPLDLLRDKRAIVDTGLGPIAFVTVYAIFGLNPRPRSSRRARGRADDRAADPPQAGGQRDRRAARHRARGVHRRPHRPGRGLLRPAHALPARAGASSSPARS